MFNRKSTISMFLIGTTCALFLSVLSTWALAQKSAKKFVKKPSVVTGTLHRVEDGAVLICVAVSKEVEVNLSKFGFQIITKKEAIQDRTILNGTACLSYQVSNQSGLIKKLKKKIGQTVELTLVRSKNKMILVKGVK